MTLRSRRTVGPRFYARPVLDVARDLLGGEIRSRTTDGAVRVRLTEVEAYAGPTDAAAHSFRGVTPRTEVMFGPPGRLYVYFTYGMHWCVNVVCAADGVASAVLLRAGEVVGGGDLARSRTPTALPDRDLARGPARLARVLGLTGAATGTEVMDPVGAVLVRPGARSVGALRIRTGPRVGVTGARDWPWRCWLDGEPTVSAYRPAVRRTAG